LGCIILVYKNTKEHTEMIYGILGSIPKSKASTSGFQGTIDLVAKCLCHWKYTMLKRT
jgi:hypothetical protein